MRSVVYGDADAIVTLITESRGKVAAIARGARKSSKRFGGALEPFHVLHVTLEDKGSELMTLKEARILRVRAGIVGDLEAVEAAGTCLRWARHLFPPRTPEPEGWATIARLLDALESRRAPVKVELARAGMKLLADVGYALDLERCVSCGKPAPEERSACVDVARGGLVCRDCGGATKVIAPALRRAARALERGEDIAARDASAIVALVDDAMAVHAGYES